MNKWTYMLVGAAGAVAMAAGSFMLATGALAADLPAAVAPGPGPGFGPGAGPGRMWQGQQPNAEGQTQVQERQQAMLAWREAMVSIRQQVHEAVAAKLGVTVAELEQAMYTGKLADLAAAKQVDVATLTQLATDTHNAGIAALVQAGTIDAQWAEQMQATQAGWAGGCLGGTGFGPGRGAGRGPGLAAGGRGPRMMGQRGGFGPGGWNQQAPGAQQN